MDSMTTKKLQQVAKLTEGLNPSSGKGLDGKFKVYMQESQPEYADITSGFYTDMVNLLANLDEDIDGWQETPTGKKYGKALDRLMTALEAYADVINSFR